MGDNTNNYTKVVFGPLKNKEKSMDKNRILKIAGTVAIVVGSGALYVSGAGESTVTGIVAGMFVLGGVIAALFKE